MNIHSETQRIVRGKIVHTLRVSQFLKKSQIYDIMFSLKINVQL